ncbi:late competence development ComFB family protein [Metabacillus niabensis]|uniref:late competence development ComFB family protein n=1 Tax=Metabacillus niabensis TaxID=324854 RepID=UPI0039A1964C
MIINAMEKIMLDLLDEYKDKLQLTCTCNECMDDIIALTLNNVQPRYVTNKEKIMYIKASYVDKQEMTSLVVKLAECAKIVSDRPLCKTCQKRVDANEMSYL